MESNNHFNYGSHSSVSANSGLKLSSGDSLYSNRSPMSFPPQEKNMNGEMNVNGVTSVIGPSVPGSHLPTASYPHMSNHHHQSSMGYDYLWGGQPQYSPAMGSSPGHGMHQKQPPPGGMQQQSQHHFQDHGQYQLNGGMSGSRQPPVAAPPNVTLTGGQYWNRGNPGQQQSSTAMAMGYNSQGVYGSYQSQVHPGIAPSQHHQQQPPQSSPHQQTQQHLHPHHHPHHQQQPQHYSMVPNGIPYYQPQHPPLPAPQPQPPSQSQSQAQMMPPTSQNFTPPRGSPQHHHIGQGGTGSPLPLGVSSVPMMSPSTMADSGSPQSQTRERSPHGGTVGMPAVMQGRMSEVFKDVDKGYNGMERASVTQLLPKCDSYPPKPPGPPMGPTSDYCQRSEQPMAQHHEMATSARESALPAPPHSMSSHPPAVSAPSTHSRLSAPPAMSTPPMGTLGPPVVSSFSVSSAPPRNSEAPMSSSPSLPVLGPPPGLSSPPLMSIRPSPVSLSTPPSGASPPLSVSVPLPKPPAPPLLLDKSSIPPAVSAPHPVSAPPPVSVAHQTAPMTSAPPAMVSTPTMVCAPLRSMSAPISALQQMVQGSRPPPLTSSPTALSGAPRENFWTPSISAVAPPPTVFVSPPAVSTTLVAVRQTSSAVPSPPWAVSAPSISVSSPPRSVSTPPPAVSAPSTESASAVSSSPKEVSMPPLTVQGPKAQASGVSSMSEPPALVSVPPAVMTALHMVPSTPPAVSAPSLSVPAPPQPPKRMFSAEPEERDMGNKKAMGNKKEPSVEPPGKPEGSSAQPKVDPVRTPSKMDATKSLTRQSEKHSHKPLTDIPGTPPPPKDQENSFGDKMRAERMDTAPLRHSYSPLERRGLDDTCEMDESADEESAYESSQVSTCLDSTRMEKTSFTEEDDACNDSSLNDTSQFGDTSRLCANSRMDDTSRLDDSFRVDGETSRFDDTSRMDEDCSRLDVASQLDDSSRIDGGKSRFDDTSCLGDSSLMDHPSREDEISHVADTTIDSSFSSVEDSRDLTLDDTQTEDSSQAEETIDSCLSTGVSMLDSSLNNTSQMEDSCVESSQNDVSRSSSNGPAKPPPAYKGFEGECESEGQDIPDSAGTTKASAVSIMAPPVMDKGKHTAALSALVGNLVAAPLLPLAAPAVPTNSQKTPRKPRKPRTPTASTPVPQVPGQAQRRSAVKTPKVDKIKVERKKKKLEKGEVVEKKEKGPPRKRKKTESVAVTVEAERSAEGLLSGQSGPITTINEPCLTSGETPPAIKPKKVRVKNLEPMPPKIAKIDVDTKPNDGNNDNDGDDSSTAGDTPRRRIATEEQVHFPLLHGWRREVRVRKTEDRLKGETWYYSPCGRRMKQFPEVIKYLNKHKDTAVTREHFSFSPRMPVGDFYEEMDSAEGVKWCLLANEEVPSMIMAITGRRGRPPNPDKEKPRPRARRTKGGLVRKPGRPPKPKMVDLLSKVDARMLERLEAKEALTEEDKEKLVKIKKKMKRKARMKRKENNKNKKIRQEKKQAKLDKAKETKDQEEVKAEPADQEPPQPAPPQPPAPEPKKRGPRKKKAAVPLPVVETDQERVAQGKRVLGARSKAKALAKAQAEAEAAAQAALAAKKQVERRAQSQRRLEERKRQQMILEQLKKPTEDMCLTDHQPLPELSRIPGVVLSGVAFSHCLTVVEFLHSYGKVLGLHIPRDVPSLSTLQESLLGLGDSQGEVQDLLIKLVEAALHDPGLPPYYQSVKILGEKLVDLELTRSTVSEGLRIFLEYHGFDMGVCNVLRTKTFHALGPDTKAAILGFLVEELNGSNIVISEIDNTLENMATYRKNKWIIEGKLRKLKAALARRTGRSEEELCLEERRRSARVAEEENVILQGSSSMERGRRAPKEEPKLDDTDSPTNDSVPELERQIDKLTKRQVFFRKKLLQSSHSLRAVSLGQDRFRRRYWVLPHLGGVLVEGPEEILASEDILVKEVPITLLKREPKVEEMLTPTTPPAPLPSSLPPKSQTSFPPEEDPLPGTASLMSRPRARGRPRKIKPEVELHLRTAKCRRRRRSSKSGGEETGPSIAPEATTNGSQDLTQSAFHNWLSQSQGAITNGTEPATGSQPEDSVKEMAEKQGQWFNLLPKQPCDKTSLTESQTPPSTPPKRLPLTPSTLPALAAPLLQSVPATSDSPPQVAPTQTPTPAKPGRRRRRGSRGSSPARRVGARGAAAKRRGRPPSTLFQEIEQQYFTQLVVKPIPASMVRGWWWIKEPEELTATLHALHPRGIREKVLHKHLAKHMEYLAEVCTRPINDTIFQVKVEVGEALLEALQQTWQVQERALETDVSALRWVEDLERRVIAADLHLKPYTVPEADSTRDDLQYYEHDTDPRDDWIVRTKKEWSDLPRVASHPLDLAVLRLANLERNIDRRYLKEPLWNLAEVVRLAPLTPEESQMGQMDVMSLESEITSRLRTWRQALDRCRSAPQLCLCLLQLEKAIAWERSVVKVTCQVCRKGDNDEYLLLCDCCDRGCHMYCLRPKVTQVPEGDWFCPTCFSKASDGESPHSNQRSSKQRTRVKKRRYEDDSSGEETVPSRRSGGGDGMAMRHKDGGPTSSSSSRYSGDGGCTTGFSPAKRRRMTTRNQPDLTYCEIILMEMESHADAWPFLEPVNPRMVPGYRRIIKNPMDFLTMRERLLQGGYCSCEEFAADAHLVFNNCEQFNEDTSEVGMAGHSMKGFFENRWAEFYESKDK